MIFEPKVSFVLMQDDRPLAKLVDLDPDRDWRDFVTTTSAWILQTYLRLKVAGSNVELRDSLPASGIAVISAGDYREALRHRMQSTGALIAAPLGSYRRRPRFADVIIVQNPSEADGKRRLFVPHWPQPGLMSRDPSRGCAPGLRRDHRADESEYISRPSRTHGDRRDDFRYFVPWFGSGTRT